EQTEVDGPRVPAHGVATIERSREDLILRPDQDPWRLRTARPLFLDLAAHKGVDLHLLEVPTAVKACETGPQALHRLTNEHAHGEAVNEMAGFGWLLRDQSPPSPREGDAFRFAQSRRDV